MLHVVTDFDGTLMHHDVGNEIMQALGLVDHEEIKEITRRFLDKQIGTGEWIKRAFALVENRQADIDRVIERMLPRQGAFDFLAYCREQSIPITILSDGMKYYIDRLLAIYNIEVSEVIANPIGYEATGEFYLTLQNDNAACSWCGCCKAGKVRSLQQAGHQVIYLGDGVSDFYGSRFADWIFARGSLAKFLDKQGETYFPFESFHDVLDVLQSRLSEFRSGTIDYGNMRRKEADFCKFA